MVVNAIDNSYIQAKKTIEYSSIFCNFTLVSFDRLNEL
jgi:hypothetical protein